MWITFYATVPELRCSFELRLRVRGEQFEAIIVPEPCGVPVVITGDHDTTACHWFRAMLAGVDDRLPAIAATG